MRNLLSILCILTFASGCTHLFYQPTPYQYFDPSTQKIPYQDVYFPSRDGTSLHAWFFPAKDKPRGTIVHFHGNAQNLSSHFVGLLWATLHGYNYFIFDYRGYGKSGGTPSPAKVHEDALAALDKGYEFHRTHGRGVFVVYGQSLGSVVSLRAVHDFGQDRVDLLVQDSAFSSYRQTAFHMLTNRWFTWPFAPAGWLLVSDSYATTDLLPRTILPTLVVVNAQDSITPPKFGRRIYDSISSPRKWFWRTRGGHIGVFHHEGGQKWRRKFIALLGSLGK